MLKKGIALTAIGIFVCFGVIAVLLFTGGFDSNAKSKKVKADDHMTIAYEQTAGGKKMNVDTPLYWDKTTERNETRKDDIKFPTIESLGFEMSGWKFVGWRYNYEDETKVIKGEYVPAELYKEMGQITFVAVWEGLSYMMSFDVRNSNITEFPKNIEITVGTPIGNRINTHDARFVVGSTPKLGNLPFQGWRTRPNGAGELVNSIYTFQSEPKDKILYAWYAANSVIVNPTTYTVTFNANGGTLNGSTTATAIINEMFVFTQNVTRQGYTFNGWYTQATGGTRITSGDTWTIANNQTLYAQYTEAPTQPQAMTGTIKYLNEDGQEIRSSRTIGQGADDVKLITNTECKFWMYKDGINFTTGGSSGYNELDGWKWGYFEVINNTTGKVMARYSSNALVRVGSNAYVPITFTATNVTIKVVYGK